MSVALPAGVSPRTLDRIEQGALCVLFVFLTYRLWPAEWSASSWYPLLLLISEGTILFFLLIRKPTDDISVNPRDWAVAAMGTFFALMVTSSDYALAVGPGMIFLIMGTIVQFGAKLSLNRSFGIVAANRGVKSDGLYALVRHPMYAGYFLTHVGFLLIATSWYNFVVYAIVWTFLIARINAEERVLSEDAAYRDFKTKTRFRIMPGIY